MQSTFILVSGVTLRCLTLADMGGSHCAYTDAVSDEDTLNPCGTVKEFNFQGGSSLCLLEIGEDYDVSETVLLHDEGGVFRDPDVSYDGRRILFAWKKSARDDDYHLYEMDFETRAVRQLTFGLGFADYEGIYLPNGDIMFSSTRCVQNVDCWHVSVSNMCLMNQDGKYMRRIGYDQVHTNYPQVHPTSAQNEDTQLLTGAKRKQSQTKAKRKAKRRHTDSEERGRWRGHGTPWPETCVSSFCPPTLPPRPLPSRLPATLTLCQC